MNNPIYLQYGGVTIYNTYKDNDSNERLLFYWFTLKSDGDSEDSFDVRNLSTFDVDTDNPAIAFIKAIDKGLVVFTENKITIFR